MTLGETTPTRGLPLPSRPATASRRHQKLMLLLGSVVILQFFPLMEYQISNYFISPNTTTASLRAQSTTTTSYYPSLNTTAETSTTSTAVATTNTTTSTTTTTNNTTTNTTTPSLNASAALEWIMSFPLGYEFTSVGGREHVLEQLRNKHILFIGDSILRYQFRALLYSLHFGHTNIKGPGNFTHPSEVYGWNFGSFNRFFQQMQNDFTEKYFQCDCFRNNSMNNLFSFENMYYFEPEYNFNFTFFFHGNAIVGGHRPLRWKAEYNKSELDIYVSQGDNASTPLVPVDFRDISLPEFVNMFLDDVGTVDELVVSLGEHWFVPSVRRKNNNSQYTWKEYARPLEQLLVSTTNTPIYALSTRKHLPAPLTSLAMEDNWKIFNRTAIIEPLVELFQKRHWPMNVMYADKIHFWGWVYDRLNAELLRVVLQRQDEPPT